MKSRVLILAAIFWFAPHLGGDAPPWWTSREVIEPHKQPEDYAAINQGQLKHLAATAYAVFNERLSVIPGGIGDMSAPVPSGETEAERIGGIGWRLKAMIESLSATNNHAPVNLGQLKAIAKPFYERLIQLGWTSGFPWDASATPANNLALANIGQAKNLFSFDLTRDTDNDKLWDIWEIARGQNPNSAYGSLPLSSPPPGSTPSGTVPESSVALPVSTLGAEAPRIPGLSVTSCSETPDDRDADISWDPPSPGEVITGYTVFRREEPAPSNAPADAYYPIGTVSASSYTYTDRGLYFGKRYFYRVAPHTVSYGVLQASREVGFTPGLCPRILLSTVNAWKASETEYGWADGLDPDSCGLVSSAGLSLKDFLGSKVNGYAGHAKEYRASVLASGSQDQNQFWGGRYQCVFTPPVQYTLVTAEQVEAHSEDGSVSSLAEVQSHSVSGGDSLPEAAVYPQGGWNSTHMNLLFIDLQVSGRNSPSACMPELTEDTAGLPVQRGEIVPFQKEGPWTSLAAMMNDTYTIAHSSNLEVWVPDETTSVGEPGPLVRYTGGVTRYPTGHLVVKNTCVDGEALYVTLNMSVLGETFSDTIKLVVQPEKRSYTVSFDEASGPRYRKIATNGRPLPDAAPPALIEQSGEPEETFIDAMTLGLRHSTSDVYIPSPGSELPLSVRREAVGEVWTTRSGLRPHERPDRPFGVGWRANLTAFVEFTTAGEGILEATVTDFQGAQHRFFNVSNEWIPLPAGRHETESYLSKLTIDYGEIGQQGDEALVFENQRGVKIWFEMNATLVRVTKRERERGNHPEQSVSDTREERVFHRAEAIEDRVGNRVEFAYAIAGTLIPKSISTVRPNTGATIRIAQGTHGLVSDIWDAGGKRYQYFYTPYRYRSPVTQIEHEEHYLSKVLRPDGGSTHYTMEFVHEIDTFTPKVEREEIRKTYNFCNLASIAATGGAGAYTFKYQRDDTRLNYRPEHGYYTQFPAPRQVNTVKLPLGGEESKVKFENLSGPLKLTYVDGLPQLIGVRQTRVTDAIGNKTTYHFENVEVIPLNAIAQMLSGARETAQLICFKSTTVQHGTLGSEQFEFSPAAGMALTKSVDLSGNVVQFFYEDTIADPDRLPLGAPPEFLGFRSEPTRQRTHRGIGMAPPGLLEERVFTYDSHRLPVSVTDWVSGNGAEKLENRAEYARDALGRVELETRSGSRGGNLSSHYGYGPPNSGWPGVPIRKTVLKVDSDDSVPSSLVTGYSYTMSTVVETADPDGIALSTTSTYDANRNCVWKTDANGYSIAFSYDAANRLVETVYPGLATRRVGYDLRGNREWEQNENGVITTYQYDALNRLIESTTRGVSTHFEYNLVGSRTAIVEPGGRRTEKTFDALQRMTAVKDPYAKVTQYAYEGRCGGSVFDSSSFKPTQITDARNFKTKTDYDASGRPTRRQAEYEPEVYAVSYFGYDGVGNLVIERDPLDQVTLREYDSLRRETRIVFQDETDILYQYSSTGLRVTVQDQRGFVTRTAYDRAGRPVKVIGPPAVGSPMTETVYDGVGNRTATINPRLARWDYVFDGRNRKIRETGPRPDGPTGAERSVSTFAYDGVGNQVSVVNPLGHATMKEYDAWNRVDRLLHPDPGGLRKFSYDGVGNLVSETDESGRETVNTFDKLNRLTRTVDAKGLATAYEYDEVGNRTAVVDAELRRTEFTYDGLKRNRTISGAAGNTTFHYDAVNKTGRTDGMGRLTNYLYDVRHRLATVTYSDRTVDNRAYTYDDAGNLLTVTEGPAKGGTADVTYEYDALNRMTAETSGGMTHIYAYDAADNRVGTTLGSNDDSTRVTVSVFDAANRLKSIAEGLRETRYEYDLGGRTVGKTLPNGDVVTTVFDAVNRPTTIIGNNGGNQLYHYALSYDLVGNLTRSREVYGVESGVGSRSVTLRYDEASRLMQESVTRVGGSDVTDYTYDRVGNRLSRTRSGSVVEAFSYGYNGLNQLTSLSGASGGVTFGYDLNGNRTSRIHATQLTSYVYDQENRLVAVGGAHKGLPLNLQYAYDYRGRRVQRTEAGQVTRVVFAGGQSWLETVGGATQVEHIRGAHLGGGVSGLLYTLRPGIPVSFSHYNQRGDVVAKTQGAGVLSWQAAYEAYGTRPMEWGASADRQKANTKEEDPSGLLNEGLRYRDLETGTFLTRDPAGFVDGPNLYGYVRQNPWSKFDPNGLSSRKTNQDVEPAGKAHHKVPVSTWDKNNLPKDVQDAFNGGDSVIPTKPGSESHRFDGHGEYNKRVDAELKKYIADNGHPGGMSAKKQKEWADDFVKQVDGTQDKYITGFNSVVGEGRSATKGWVAKEGTAIVKAETNLLKRMGKIGGQIMDHGGRVLKVGSVIVTVSQFAETARAEGVGQAGVDAFEQTINPIGLSSREMKQVHRRAYEGFWDSLTEGVYDNDMRDKWNTLRE